MKRWRIGVVLALAAMQLVTFERTNPPVTSEIRAAPEVTSVLRRACYDCHSNETVWPWYSHVAPVSWLMHRDVTGGRAALNFSSWGVLPVEKKSKSQHQIAEDVTEGEMPPWFYRPLHPHAALSATDKQLIQTWAQSARGAREGKDGEDGD